MDGVGEGVVVVVVAMVDTLLVVVPDREGSMVGTLVRGGRVGEVVVVVAAVAAVAVNVGRMVPARVGWCVVPPPLGVTVRAVVVVVGNGPAAACHEGNGVVRRLVLGVNVSGSGGGCCDGGSGGCCCDGGDGSDCGGGVAAAAAAASVVFHSCAADKVDEQAATK